MNIREGFVLRRVMGKAMVIAVGSLAQEFRAMITLNDTAEDLWTWLQEDVSEEILVARLCDTYEVSADVAAADVRRLLDTLRAEGILEE